MANGNPYAPPGTPNTYDQGGYAPGTLPQMPGQLPVPGSAPKSQSGGGRNVGQKPKSADPLGTSTSGNSPSDDEMRVEELHRLIQEFLNELSQPLDYNDPYVKHTLDNARAMGMESAENRGLFGGYSQRNAEQAWVKGSAALQDQRQNRRAAMLGLGLSSAQNIRDFGYQKAKDAYQNQLDLWKYDQEKGPNLGSTIGGLYGGAAGGLLGFAFGGPAGAAAGAGAGYNLGAGVGGQIGGMFGSTPPPQWNYGGNWKPGGT